MRRAAAATLALSSVLVPGMVMAPGAAGGTPGSGGTVEAAQAASPTVVGPVTGGRLGYGLGTSVLDLAARGFVEEEYFIEGTARSYTSAAPLSPDGRWSVTPAATAAYRTRVIVRRPSDPARFNGTVVVEWNNVTAGFDNQVGWGYLAPYLLRGGFAYVGVSAQAVGVNGFPPGNPLGNALALKVWDPSRYGSLVHPGDSFSYDIFSQAGQAVRATGSRLMGNLRPTKVLATGESQSAGRMVTYINAIAPLDKVYDGYFVHSRGASAAALSQEPQAAVAAPNPTRLRTDLTTPVLVWQSESDVVGSAAARQEDSNVLRWWEVAGTSHADQYQISNISADGVRAQADATSIVQPCEKPTNNGPATYVLRAALAALDRWVRDATPPPVFGRIELAGEPLTVQRDEYGLAKGGVRPPQVDVPTAVLSGDNAGPVFCRLFGSWRPFTPEQLARRYANRAAYQTEFRQAADRAVAQGVILSQDRDEIVARAVEDIYAFGDARFFGSTGAIQLNSPVVGIAGTSTRAGHWTVAADGGVFAFGDARFFGSMGGQRLNAPIVGIAGTPTNGGYWLVAADGGVFAFGNARFLGSMGGQRLNAPIVGMAATRTGNGYWLVARDGGIFAFGDAAFSGSTGGLRLNAPIVGMAADPDGRGYWLAGADGGVFAFEAAFAGSGLGRVPIADQDDRVVGIAAASSRGYWLALTSGRTLAIGDAPYVFDATGSQRLTVGIAGSSTGRGYWLAVRPAL